MPISTGELREVLGSDQAEQMERAAGQPVEAFLKELSILRTTVRRCRTIPKRGETALHNGRDRDQSDGPYKGRST
jgi:hypothetical protein